jgi:surface antigen
MKILKTFVLSLLIASTMGGVANAQEPPRPLSENEAFIQQQSQEVEKKSGLLLNTTQELQSLEQKKIELSQKLESENKTIEELKGKLEEKRAAAEAEKKRLAEIKNMFVHVTRYAGNSSGNLYAAGNCTWYAKSRRPDLPNNLGNANRWYANAAAQGWNVGSAPKKGAVGTTTAGGLGHVVYVEGVSLDGQFVTISEMNYGGLYSMNTRTVHFSEFLYIYELE